MAIALKSKKYNEIVIDSNIINGVLGNNYEEFLRSFKGSNIYYLEKNNRKITNSVLNHIDTISGLDNLEEYTKLLDIDNIKNKNINELSHSDKRLIEYFLMIESNASIMIINEVYLDLDSDQKRKITVLVKKLIKLGKTIIIGSNDSNVIYSLCKKVLLVNDNNIYYDSVDILSYSKIINKYHLSMPNILIFINEAKKKNINIPKSKDIRDLIKDVYRNVSKK